jgi:hypothetical protein
MTNSKYRDYDRVYNSKYYQAHKETILQNKKTPVQCNICKRNVLKVNYHRHLSTNIHHANLLKNSSS